jgi:hypothetical protein
VDFVGQKHVIKCRCILPQFKKHLNPPVHEFIVFSATIDDVFQESIALCNNCAIAHTVYDFCQSRILNTKEGIGSMQTIDDICLSLPDDLEGLLKSSGSDLATFQHVDFVLSHELWDTKILLQKEEAEGYITGKSLVIVNDKRFRVVPFTQSIEVKRD